MRCLLHVLNLKREIEVIDASGDTGAIECSSDINPPRYRWESLIRVPGPTIGRWFANDMKPRYDPDAGSIVYVRHYDDWDFREINLDQVKLWWDENCPDSMLPHEFFDDLRAAQAASLIVPVEDKVDDLKSKGFVRLTVKRMREQWGIGVDTLEAMARRAAENGHIHADYRIVTPKRERQLWARIKG
jgi:hypothetical protein